jgi:aminoglycoside phosphotransferase family enzyme
MGDRIDRSTGDRCALARAAYPTDPSAERGVRHIQTHLSRVSDRELVYKLRKAVRFGFVNFATRASQRRLAAGCV